MAKPQIITLPFVLLLWDFWPLQRTTINSDTASCMATCSPALPRKRISALIVEKIPLFILAAASAVITLYVQLGARHGFPRLLRVGNGILSYVLYLRNALWPLRLALFYPHPMAGLVWRQVFVAAAVLLAITALVVLGKGHGYLPVGWFWFLGTLVPMLGIVQVGVQAMADRYAYISFIGLFILICWGVADVAEHMRMPKFVLSAVSLIMLFALGAELQRQIAYWRSNSVLWQHTLEVTHNNWTAERMWGDALLDAGRMGEAIPHFEKVIRYAPEDSLANRAIGLNDMLQDEYAAAIPRLEIAAKDKDVSPAVLRETYVALAKAYWEIGDKQKSRDSLQASRMIRIR